MKIIAYETNSEKNKVTKSLGFPVEFDGVLKEETDILAPEITFATPNPLGSNYAYIPDFHRYYFITNQTSIRKGLWRISLQVDVLMSFKDKILQQNAIISRQENVYNLYIQDPEFVMESKRRQQVKSWPHGFPRTPNYILVLNGSMPLQT